MPLLPPSAVIETERTWQVQLLSLILRLTFWCGLVVYIPSLYLSLRVGVLGIALIDTIAIVVVGVLHFWPTLSYLGRAIGFCLVFYMLAVGLLIWVGPISQIYLFGFTTVATLLLGYRLGFVTSVLSSLTLLVIGAIGWGAPGMLAPTWGTDVTAWIVVTLNFALVNLMQTAAVGMVVSTLQGTLEREMGARASLQREHTLLRTLIDALPDVIFAKDTHRRYQRGNAALLTQLGLTREVDLLGRSDDDLVPPAEARTYREHDEQVLQGTPLFNQELPHPEADGTLRWYLTNKVPLRDAGGGIVGLIGIARDITDVKRAEADRAHLLARLQLQIERMPLAYLLTDATFRYVRWNPAAERMFGFTEAEVLGRHPFDLIVPTESQEEVTRRFDQIMAGSMDAHGEIRNRTRDGRTIICEWHNTPLVDETGAVTGVLSLAEDVTERRSLEEQLQQAQKMEAVGRLAGGVAHDFNNLLTLIIGYSELLLSPPRAALDVPQSVRAIRDAAERAATLTRQLLGFSRQSLLQPRVLDLNVVVATISTMLRRLIGEDILLTTSLAPVLARVKVDPGQLDQVLMNLAVNARDAMPTGGHLRIETSSVMLDGSAHVRLTMSDTGSGMTPDVVARIFDPFFTTKPAGRGTGLGLAMVHGVVQQSGGRIEVRSEPGQGTTFTLDFPAVDDAGLKEESPALPEHVGGDETILVVEDEESVRGLVVRTLASYGYSVVAATNGQDALRVATAHAGPIDLVLTDIVMPAIGGPELVRRLRPTLPQARTLFMSGYTDDAVMRHGVLESDVAFIQKPYTPAELARKVREVLDMPRAPGEEPAS